MSILLWITIEMEYKIKVLQIYFVLYQRSSKTNRERVNVGAQHLPLLPKTTGHGSLLVES